MAEPGMSSLESGAPKKEKFTVAIIDNSEQAESAARDAADARMTASKNDLRGLSGFFKKIWTHNIAYDYYRQKEIAAARRKIQGDQNVFAAEGGNAEDHDTAMQAIAERFIAEGEEMMHEGETRDRLEDGEMEVMLKANIKNLVTDYALGRLDDTSFGEEKNRILSSVQDMNGDRGRKGSLYADNLKEVARGVREALEYGRKMEELDLDFDVVIGKAKGGVRTEAQYNAVDRITDRIMNSKVGRFFNETTVASAVAITYAVGAKLSQRVASNKALAWGTLGASATVGAGLAGARESRRLEMERKQHFREMAQGKKFDPEKSPRRKEMEEYRYETRTAEDMRQTLEASLYEYKEDGTWEVKNLSQEELKAAFANLAEIESRIKLSDRMNVDLVSFTDIKKVEQERLQLDLARATAKKDMEKLLASRTDLAIPDGMNVRDYAGKLSEVRMDQMINGDAGIERKNADFKKMKHKQVAKAVVKGLATGLTIGVAAQEIKSFFSGNTEGIFEPRSAHAAPLEGGGHDPQHVTALEGLRRFLSGEEPPRMDMSRAFDVKIGHNNFLTLPEGAKLVGNPDGSYNLLRGDDIVSRNIQFDSRGLLTEESMRMLENDGVHLHVENDHILNPNGGTMATPDYLDKHPELTADVQRRLWYDNDTPKPVFDKNELKLWFGGEKNTGIDAEGNFVFDVKQMAPDGSYHGKFSAEAEALMKAGKLKMMFSLSRDTQNHVFEIPINEQGQAVIDPKSEMGKLLFAAENGQAKFLGRYAEVAESLGDKNGVEQVRVLATHEGAGVDTIVGGPAAEEFHRTIFEVPAPGPDVEPPMFIPIMGRRPLEKTTGIYPYLSGYFKDDKRNEHYYHERRSPRLENPNVKLDHHQEIEDYFKRQPEEWVKKIRQLDHQLDSPMEKECRMAICIPAAGHQEGKNIFHTLENYKDQKNADGSPIDPRSFEVVVFVNYPKDREPDQTIEEIKRFQEENPEMRVRMVQKALDRSEVRIGTIRKYATDLALLRHHQRGPGTSDLIVVSNDADCSEMSDRYVSNFFDEFKKHPNADALLGKIDWERDAYVKAPLIHLGTRFFQYIDIVTRHHKNKSEKSVASSGANFAIKSSIYAAVGGYNEQDRIAEDRNLGIMIKTARRGAATYPIEYAGKQSFIMTNARRAVDALKRGVSPAEQWGTEFGADDLLRETDWEIDGSADLDSATYQESLRKGIERFINRTLRVYELQPDSWTARKAVGFLGVGYAVRNVGTERRLVITDVSKLIERLKEYKEGR